MEQQSGIGAAVGRRAKATWRSYRGLPIGWQAAFGVLLLILLVAAGDQHSPVNDLRLASKQGPAAPASSAEELPDPADVSQLREQLASAEADADRAEAQRLQGSEQSDATISGLQDRAAALEDANQELRRDLSESREALRVVRNDASRLKDKLAAASSAVTTTPAVAAVAPAKPAPSCHSSYKGACVPITSDVDCAGGSGDGPAYVGYVQVVGYDEYDLDADGNGVGCE